MPETEIPKVEVQPITSPTPEQKKKLTERQKKIIIAMSSVALALSIFIASVITIDKASGNKKTSSTISEEPSATSSQELTPTITMAPEILPTVESLEIDKSETLNPAEFAKTLTEGVLSDWINTGATPENMKLATEEVDNALKVDSSIDLIREYAKKVTEEYDKIYIEALFAEGWESNANLVKWINDIKTVHLATVEAYYKTSMPDLMPADKEPYRRWMVFEKLISSESDANTLTIQFRNHDSDNSADNRVGEELTNGTKIDPASFGTPKIELTDVDGKMKIKNVDRRIVS